MNQTVQKGHIRIYACGGAGLNIGRQLEQHRGISETAFATLDICYTDTSRSNLQQDIPSDVTYLIDGLDGSGKIRAENHQEITKHVRNILQQFKPADLNIVVSSGAGGSGSVFAPLIASELLADDNPTIVFTIGSTDTRLDAENTLKTLKSYEAISKKNGRPIVMLYRQNGQLSRKAVDDDVKAMVLALAALYSRENHDLDTRDLYNWLNFHRVTTFPAQLVTLHMVDVAGSHKKSSGNVISVATLAKEGDSTVIEETPEYQCVGYIPNEPTGYLTGCCPIHFITCDGDVPVVVGELNKFIKNLEDQKNARIAKDSILSPKDNQVDSGLVL